MLCIDSCVDRIVSDWGAWSSSLCEASARRTRTCTAGSIGAGTCETTCAGVNLSESRTNPDCPPPPGTCPPKSTGTHPNCSCPGSAVTYNEFFNLCVPMLNPLLPDCPAGAITGLACNCGGLETPAGGFCLSPTNCIPIAEDTDFATLLTTAGAPTCSSGDVNVTFPYGSETAYGCCPDGYVAGVGLGTCYRAGKDCPTSLGDAILDWLFPDALAQGMTPTDGASILNSVLGALQSNGSLAGLLKEIRDNVDDVEGFTDGLEGHVDGLESSLTSLLGLIRAADESGTVVGNLVSIKTSASTLVNTLTQAVDCSTNTDPVLANIACKQDEAVDELVAVRGLLGNLRDVLGVLGQGEENVRDILESIDGHVDSFDDLISHVDGLESGVTGLGLMMRCLAIGELPDSDGSGCDGVAASSNVNNKMAGHLSDIKSHVDGLEDALSSIDGNVDGLETALTTINTTLSGELSIDDSALISAINANATTIEDAIEALDISGPSAVEIGVAVNSQTVCDDNDQTDTLCDGIRDAFESALADEVATLMGSGSVSLDDLKTAVEDKTDELKTALLDFYCPGSGSDRDCTTDMQDMIEGIGADVWEAGFDDALSSSGAIAQEVSGVKDSVDEVKDAIEDLEIDAPDIDLSAELGEDGVIDSELEKIVSNTGEGGNLDNELESIRDSIGRNNNSGLRGQIRGVDRELDSIGDDIEDLEEYVTESDDNDPGNTAGNRESGFTVAAPDMPSLSREGFITGTGCPIMPAISATGAFSTLSLSGVAQTWCDFLEVVGLVLMGLTGIIVIRILVGGLA